MSVKTTTKVWEWSKAEGTDRLVMLALADFCDDDGVCFPGVARLAKKCRVSPRTIQRAFVNLQTLGELKIEEKAGAMTNGGATNRFILSLKGGDNMTGGMGGGGDIQGAKVVTSVTKGGDKGVTQIISQPSVESSDREPSLFPETKKTRFIPPSIPEIESYFTEAGMNGKAHIEAVKFYNHHDARGWMMSRGVKMAKWKSAAATWKTNAETFAAKLVSSTTPPGIPGRGNTPCRDITNEPD